MSTFTLHGHVSFGPYSEDYPTLFGTFESYEKAKTWLQETGFVLKWSKKSPDTWEYYQSPSRPKFLLDGQYVEYSSVKIMRVRLLNRHTMVASECSHELHKRKSLPRIAGEERTWRCLACGVEGFTMPF